MPDLFDRRSVPLVEQVASARREVAYRERVYPRLVAAGKMTQALADRELAAMQAIVETLADLVDREARGR